MNSDQNKHEPMELHHNQFFFVFQIINSKIELKRASTNQLTMLMALIIINLNMLAFIWYKQ